jgi:hypothetical protein
MKNKTLLRRLEEIDGKLFFNGNPYEGILVSSRPDVSYLVKNLRDPEKNRIFNEALVLHQPYDSDAYLEIGKPTYSRVPDVNSPPKQKKTVVLFNHKIRYYQEKKD